MQQVQPSLMIRIPSQESIKSRGTPKAPKLKSKKESKKETDYEVLCSAGCGMTCDPRDHIGGFCSRDCFMEVYKSSYMGYE